MEGETSNKQMGQNATCDVSILIRGSNTIIISTITQFKVYNTVFLGWGLSVKYMTCHTTRGYRLFSIEKENPTTPHLNRLTNVLQL